MTKFSKLKNYFVVISTILVLFFTAVEVFAAEFIIDLENQEIRINEQFEADFFLNTEEKNINAIEGKIMFPSELLELKEIRDGNSIINFWIERPEVKSNNLIIFSGITPGGYIGKNGLVFSLIFQSKKEGSGVIEIRNIKALLNDGEGTEALTTISNFQFLISKQTATPQVPIPKIKDIDLPELFTPEITKDPNIFNGKWFLVFATQDKGSGIDYYEISESENQFVIAESPYLLKNQFLDKEITIKAIDKSGNERIVILPAQNPTRYENYLIFVIIGWIILIYVIWRILRKFFKKNDKN